MNLSRQLVFLHLLLLLTTWSTATGAAGALQDMQILRQQGGAWLEQQAMLAWPGVRARARTGILDERLRLSACRDLQFFLPAGGRLGNSGSLGVQCVAPARWSVYLGFQMALSGPALVARRALPARAALASDDLEARVIDYAQAPSAYLNDIRLVPGARLIRPIPAGQPLLAEWIVRAPSISAGQRVRIVAHGTGFSVNQEGSALNTAAAGEPVRVKIQSGRIVQGQAQEDGSVLVQP